MKNCESIRAEITALLDGELTAAVAAEVEAHLVGCAECTRYWEEMAAISHLTETWTVDGGDIWEAVHPKIKRAAREVLPMEAPSVRRERGAVTVRKGLGEILREKGYITAAMLRQARDVQKSAPGELGRLLIDLGFATERDVVQARAEAENLPFIDLTRHKPEPSAVNVVPEHVVKKYNALPVKKDGQRLWVAMADPKNIVAIDDIRMVSRCPMVQPMVAVPADLEDAISRTYTASTPPQQMGGPEPDFADGLRLLREEIQALRGEMKALRTEVSELRQGLQACALEEPRESNEERPSYPPRKD